MESSEHIHSHLLSVWRESRRFLSIGGREGMLILTDAHVMFIQKTTAKPEWWHALRRRQTLELIKSKDTMITHDGYNESVLAKDMENPKNMELAFDDILDIHYEEKDWGSVLYMEYVKGGKKEKYQYSIAQDWVKYPAKDAIKFMRVDWSPFVKFIKERQRITR